MAIKETNILKKIQIKLSKAGARLLRNNTGLFITIDGKRKLHAGLGKSTSDLIGWIPIIITKDMIGKRIAIFTAIEVKSKSGLKNIQQKQFISTIKEAGGYAGFARTEQEALDIIS